MKQEIQNKFESNINRVKSLVNIYKSAIGNGAKGRRGHEHTDILRAAVVLLHATTEDLLRSLAYWRLPSAGSQVLSNFALPNSSGANKFTLGDLSAHRGSTVEDVIKKSVDAYLEKSNYNNNKEVSGLLTNIGLNVSMVNHTFSLLEKMMLRRHQIVHRADLNSDAVGRGNHKIRTIGHREVDQWINNVEAFGKSIFNQLP